MSKPRRMRELEIKRSNLVPFRLGDAESERRCILGHILVAAGETDPVLEYPRGRWPTPQAAPLFTKQGQVRADVCARVVNAFDNGDEATAIKALRRYGWNVTILEDR